MNDPFPSHRSPDTEKLSQPGSESASDRIVRALSQRSDLQSTADRSALFLAISQLDAATKQAICRLLLPQLDAEALRDLLDLGKSELASREGKVTLTRKPPDRCTRLVLKKDYSFQKLNLTDPTQYFVYLVRRKPKLDRYIGALFYIPQGLPLSYFPDAEGRIVFTAPNNVFRLTDAQTGQVQMVRLLSIDPPAPDYTFDRGQQDTPDIWLCLDYLDAATYEPISTERYHYPTCMYEGGRLDRYRWSVEPLLLPPDVQVRLQATPTVSPAQQTLSVSSQTAQTISQLAELGDASAVNPNPSSPAPTAPPPSSTLRPKKFILTDLPKANFATYYLADAQQRSTVLERLRLYATLSELATPHAKWVLEHKGDHTYHLLNSKSKRLIVQFNTETAAVTLQSSFPVIMTGFRDLARAASQTTKNQRMTPDQQTLVHRLHVEMGLPQQNPLEILGKLFGVAFRSPA